MKHLILAGAFALPLVSGCTTEPVRPVIKTFADTVQQAVSAGNSSFTSSDLDARVAAVLRQELAKQRGLYFLDPEGAGICEPAIPPPGPGVAAAPGFDDVCTVRPFAPGPDGTPVAVDLILPPVRPSEIGPDGALTDTQRTVLEFNARRALTALGEYAAAISDLATSTEPQGVADAASAAVTAIGTAASAAAKIGGKPVPRDVQTVISTGSTLLGDLVGEALEARRYALLTEIVRKADPLVADLSRASADWFYIAQHEVLAAPYTALRGALRDSQPGDVAGMIAVQQAEAAARRSEAGADWRVFWQVAVAHHAILESLEEPADFDRLMAANSRIHALVKSTKAFVAAVEAAKE